MTKTIRVFTCNRTYGLSKVVTINSFVNQPKKNARMEAIQRAKANSNSHLPDACVSAAAENKPAGRSTQHGRRY